MAKNDHLDLLIAEMLGDVGKLHSEIKVLKDEALPAIVTDAEQRLSEVVGTLIGAADRYQTVLQAATNEIVKRAKSDIEREAERAKSETLNNVRQTVRDVVVSPATALTNDLRAAVMRANEQQGSTFKHAIAAAIVGGIVSGLVVLGGGYYFLKNSTPDTSPRTEDTASAKPLKGSKGK